MTDWTFEAATFFLFLCNLYTVLDSHDFLITETSFFQLFVIVIEELLNGPDINIMKLLNKSL